MCLNVSLSPPANLLLQDTVERIHVGTQYGDIPRGIYLVRGENVALCGEIVSHKLLAFYIGCLIVLLCWDLLFANFSLV